MWNPAGEVTDTGLETRMLTKGLRQRHSIIYLFMAPDINPVVLFPLLNVAKQNLSSSFSGQCPWEDAVISKAEETSHNYLETPAQ